MDLTIPVDPDPIKGPNVEVTQIRVGTRHDPRTRPVLHELVIGNRRTRDVCHERDPDTAYFCNRPVGHPAHWRHIASNGEQIIAIWGGGPAPKAEVIPEDGSPADPTDLKVDAPEIGGVYRIRDRKNIIQVIDGTTGRERADGRLDALDLTARQYRVIDPTWLVPTDYTPTVEDFKFVTQYTSKMRATTRDEAIANYHEGLWCEAGLQDGLRDLGLAKYVPEQSGTVTIKIPYSGPSDMSTGVPKDAVEKLFNTAALTKLEYPADNEDDLVLRISELSVRVENVRRK
jgi:hypothetical protein